MRISDWSSDVCSSDLAVDAIFVTTAAPIHGVPPERRARVHFIPNPVDPAIDAGRGFARSDQAHDLFFAVGTAHGSADRLALVKAALARLPGLRADLLGLDSRRDRTSVV